MKHLLVSIPARDFAAIQLLEELLLIGRDQLDQLVVQGFFFREGLGVADGLFRQLAIAAAACGHAAEQCGGVILHFFSHGLFHLLSEQYGRGSAGVGAGRHGGDIAGFEQKESSRGSAGTARSDVRDNRHGRCREFFNQVASRVEQPAWSVETNQENFGVLGLGLFEGVAHDFHRDGMHHSVNVHRKHACRWRLGPGRKSERGHHEK